MIYQDLHQINLNYWMSFRWMQCVFFFWNLSSFNLHIAYSINSQPVCFRVVCGKYHLLKKLNSSQSMRLHAVWTSVLQIVDKIKIKTPSNYVFLFKKMCLQLLKLKTLPLPQIEKRRPEKCKQFCAKNFILSLFSCSTGSGFTDEILR